MDNEQKKIPEQPIDPETGVHPAAETIKYLNLAKAAYNVVFETTLLTVEDRDNITRIANTLYMQERKEKYYKEKGEQDSKKPDVPATEKQIQFMKDLNVTIPNNCTLVQAKKLIQDKVGKK